MDVHEVQKILLSHFDEFPEDVKLAVDFMLKNLDSFCCKKMRDIWQGIKQRCFNPNNKSYWNYGGRGITMFPAWVEDFQAFYDYVSQLEHFSDDGYTLDRINNNGNYEPNNLRWADKNTQDRNRRTSVIVEHQGVKMCLKDFAKVSGVNYVTLRSRYRRGQDLFNSVKETQPLPLVEYDGELITLKEAAKRTGLKYNTLWHRFIKGVRGEELFAPPHSGKVYK